MGTAISGALEFRGEQGEIYLITDKIMPSLIPDRMWFKRTRSRRDLPSCFTLHFWTRSLDPVEVLKNVSAQHPDVLMFVRFTIEWSKEV